MLPDASWVMVSVAGRYAGAVARQSLRAGKHVFLFSDNVSVEEEIALKQQASEAGLLVMGPDCGTALIGGMGLGFANKVRKGPIGVVAAAGTGLQHVTARIHQLGGGITHGIGTGGRDLSEKVGAVTFRQAVELLSRDPETKVIVLVSKPPSPKVADEVLKLARQAGKPVVVNFIARSNSTTRLDNLYFVTSLDQAAELAVELAAKTGADSEPELGLKRFGAGQKYLRGLFSGGTLAYEAQHILAGYLPKVYANAPINKENKLPNSNISQEHCIVDLGEDEFTQGRLHPMMDNDLRVRRLLEEAEDPSVAVIMLDVVIGFGSHPDPASELAPAIAKAQAKAKAAGRYLEVVAVVTGTDADPQMLQSQISQLKAVGVWVETSNEAMVRYAGRLLRALEGSAAAVSPFKPVDLASLQKPLAAINVGLESFAENLAVQGAPTVHVDWRPPAGGNERLAAILERMKQQK
jgi:FdrA protein